MPNDNNVLNDLWSISLSDFEYLPNLRKEYFNAIPEICIERPRLVTQYHLHYDLLNKDQISSLDKARVYRNVLEKRQPIVRHRNRINKSLSSINVTDTSPFAGSTTSKFKGVILYPEFLGMALWPELSKITGRKQNPYNITEAEVEELNLEIFPHWMKKNILELTRTQCYMRNRPLKTAPEIKLLQNIVFFLTSKALCISHTIPDFSQVIKKGLRSIIYEAMTNREDTDDPEKKLFYQSMVEVLEGIITYARNLSAQAQLMASQESDPREKAELRNIADIYRWVPEYPARTFREGLTAVWVVWTAIHLENPNVGLSLGRLDQVLYDLYEKDRQKGLTVKEAVRLVCYLWLKIGDHVPAMPETGEKLFGGTGSNQAITIGGVDPKGEDAVNELTYVMLKATELMRLRDPNLNARYYHGINPPEYLRKLCDVNIETGATPAIHNDKAVIRALIAKGDDPEAAHDYGIVGCVEPGSNGRHYGHSASILLNLPSALELALYNGRHRHTGLDRLISLETGNASEIDSFDKFKEAFSTQLCWMIDKATQLNNYFGEVHQNFYPTPILSSFFEGPMKKGLDLIRGGATINSSGAAIIGFADVVDSLSAIKKWVFEEKKISLAELCEILNNNFAGKEDLQKLFSNQEKTPKYGNEDMAADGLAKWLVGFLNQEFGNRENYRDGHYRVGYWTMTIHAGLGQIMKATPNGRMDGENLASGITPVSRATPNLTAMLNSVAQLPPEALSSGVALNLKFTPELDDRDKFLDNFTAYIKGYFDDSINNQGLEIQFNITTHDKFLEAVKSPDKHQDLLVRVSGYTAYFKDLNPQMQKEIIDRTEYLLSKGSMQAFPRFELK